MNYLYNFGLVDLENLCTEDIDTVSIAKALCRINRHAGNFNSISVAQHCVVVAQVVGAMGGSPEQQMAALHHDDSEVFIGDVPSPVKDMCPMLQAIEESIMAVIDEKYGIYTGCDVVHEADEIVGARELHHHMDMSPSMARYTFSLPENFLKVTLGQTVLTPWPYDKVLARYMEYHDEMCEDMVAELDTSDGEKEKVGCLN